MKKNKNLLHLGNPLLIAAAANTAGEVISKQADLRKEKIVADKIGYVVVLMNLAGVTEKNHIH